MRLSYFPSGPRENEYRIKANIIDTVDKLSFLLIYVALPDLLTHGPIEKHEAILSLADMYTTQAHLSQVESCPRVHHKSHSY